MAAFLSFPRFPRQGLPDVTIRYRSFTAGQAVLSDKKLIITGATGNIAGSVIERLSGVDGM